MGQASSIPSRPPNCRHPGGARPFALAVPADRHTVDTAERRAEGLLVQASQTPQVL